MRAAEARSIAHQAHYGQRTRHGDELTEHVERVAAAVPPEARTIAFLHDVLEHSQMTLEDLCAHGLTELERDVLALLTREPGESFEAHALRVAYASGPAAALGRTIRLADLDDHLRCRRVPGAPPWAWARRHLIVSRDRCDRPRAADHPTAA